MLLELAEAWSFKPSVGVSLGGREEHVEWFSNSFTLSKWRPAYLAGLAGPVDCCSALAETIFLPLFYQVENFYFDERNLKRISFTLRGRELMSLELHTTHGISVRGIAFNAILLMRSAPLCFFASLLKRLSSKLETATNTTLHN